MYAEYKEQFQEKSSVILRHSDIRLMADSTLKSYYSGSMIEEEGVTNIQNTN